ncbi:MAG: hypothetical protein ACYCX2_02495 [Christensenellales bacterium]
MEKARKPFEHSLMRFVFGAVAPVACFLAFWWGSISLVTEQVIPFCALAGLDIGIILYLVFIRKHLTDVYRVPMRYQVAVFLFYSVCTFGFFMGVPVFNLLAGTLAGYYTGRRLRFSQVPPQQAKKAVFRTAVFTSFVIAVFCAASAMLALSSPLGTARNLEGMLRLPPYTVTTPRLYALILIGGALVIAGQYWLVKRIANRAFQKE